MDFFIKCNETRADFVTFTEEIRYGEFRIS